MKYAVLLAVLIASNAEAATTARVFPMSSRAMITAFQGPMGGYDVDGKTLYDAMNVPVQSTFLGPGKSIQDRSQDLSWVCANRGGQDGHQCTFMIQKSPPATIREYPVRIEYKINGDEADRLARLIFPNQPGDRFYFESEDGRLKISASSNTFLLIYNE